MKRNYKLQRKVAGAGDRCRWGKEKDVLRTYFKLSIVDCQLSIVNETSTHVLLRDLNFKQKTKGGHGLHKGSSRLQNMTAFNQKLLWGVQGGGFLEKSPPGMENNDE